MSKGSISKKKNPTPEKGIRKMRKKEKNFVKEIFLYQLSNYLLFKEVSQVSTFTYIKVGLSGIMKVRAFKLPETNMGGPFACS
jgi:hypothetical protein